MPLHVKVAMVGPVPADWGGLKRHGGVATHVQGLTREISKADLELSLLADNTNQRIQAGNSDIPQGVSFYRQARSPVDLARIGWKSLPRISARLIQHRIHLNSFPLNYLPNFMGQAVNLEHFLSNVKFNLIHVQHSEFRQFLCQQILDVAVPIIATLQSVSVLIRPHEDWLENLVVQNYQNADWLISVSNYVMKVAVDYGANPQRISVIPNGVDVDRFHPAPKEEIRAELNLPRGDFIILYTGNLIPLKGVDQILHAVKLISEKPPSKVKIAILGKGPEKENLVRLAGELGISEQVHFAGFVSRADIPRWYQASDIFVLPSWAEGLSLSVLEAMASGVPVITTYPEFGSHDAVFPGETGFLTHYGDVEALAKALEQAVNQREHLQEMGRNARRLAEERFSWEVVGRQTIDVYRRVLVEKGRA